MTDKDFIIEEPETLENKPKEEVLTFEPKEEVLSFDVPAKPSIEQVVTPIPQTNIEQVVSNPAPEVVTLQSQPKPQPVYNIVPPSVADAREKAKASEEAELLHFGFGPKPEVSNPAPQTMVQPQVQPTVEQPAVQTTVEQPVGTSAMATIAESQIASTMEPQVAQSTEEAIIKEVTTAAPNKINDDVLKVEDTMLSNNLKEDVNEALKAKDEESQNKRARAFIITLFLLLGVTILLLPVLTNIFS